MVTVTHYVALSFLLFAIGVTGVLIRRNLLTVLMSIELDPERGEPEPHRVFAPARRPQRAALHDLRDHARRRRGRDRPRDHHLALPSQGFREPGRRVGAEGVARDGGRDPPLDPRLPADRLPRQRAPVPGVPLEARRQGRAEGPARGRSRERRSRRLRARRARRRRARRRPRGTPRDSVRGRPRRRRPRGDDPLLPRGLRRDLPVVGRDARPRGRRRDAVDVDARSARTRRGSAARRSSWTRPSGWTRCRRSCSGSSPSSGRSSTSTRSGTWGTTRDTGASSRT